MEKLKYLVLEIENEVKYYDELQHLDSCDYSERISSLLKLRKRLMDEYVLKNLDKYIDKICEFDERLVSAFRDDFKNKQRVKEEATNIQRENKQVESTLYLREHFGEKPFWSFFNYFGTEDDTYILLGIGYAKSFRSKPKRSAESSITFDDTMRAVREEREVFQNRPLSISFFYLLEETYFSLLDLISIYNFYSWTTIRVMNEYTKQRVEFYGDKVF